MSIRWKTISIKRGRHRSKFSWVPFFVNGKAFSVVFDESAKYELPEPHNHAINKLIGFSDGGLNHHRNSFRLGWRYDSEKDKIEVLSYVYVDGIVIFRSVAFVNFYQPITFEVSCQEDVYRILENRYKVHYAPRSQNIKWKYKHMLWPYFGGQKKAPHSIFLMLNWKNKIR
jgi:hypothetical protein